eukprot:1648306-Prymnesium_polylepis.1
MVLQSGLIKGVGPKLAATLVDRFGEQTLDVLQGNVDGARVDPELLLTVPGVGPKKLAVIQASVAEWQSKAGTLTFARALGLSERQASALVKALPQEAEAQVRANPYVLCGAVPGLDFRAVDALAISRLDVEPTSHERGR